MKLLILFILSALSLSFGLKLMLSGDLLFFPIFVFIAAIIAGKIAEVEIKMVKADFGNNPDKVLDQLRAVGTVSSIGVIVTSILLFVHKHDLIIFASAGLFTVFTTNMRVVAHFSGLYRKR